MEDLGISRGAVPERISTALAWSSGIGLCVTCPVLYYLMHVPASKRNQVGFVPGIAFRGGIAVSAARFVSGYWIRSRLRSVATMIVAVAMALAWFLVAFVSVALMGSGV